MLYFLALYATALGTADSFSVLNDVRSSIYASADATTIPSDIFSLDQLHQPAVDFSYSSDFVPQYTSTPPSSFQEYASCSADRHKDCQDLFDFYDAKVIRCEQLSSDDMTASKYGTKEFMIRWEVSWVMAGSVWLYKLADVAGWDIIQKPPDPSSISIFSWKNVFRMFGSAFETGVITLPISRVEGSTRLKISTRTSSSTLGDNNCTRLSIKESIDLVREGDLGRLQNRKVAQELAAWLDVSRRPGDTSEESWAGIVRSRILSAVPGAGALDIDPNEEEEGALALLVFGVTCLMALTLSYNLLLGEVGPGQVSKFCDDTHRVELGSGYFSECVGPYGDWDR